MCVDVCSSFVFLLVLKPPIRYYLSKWLADNHFYTDQNGAQSKRERERERERERITFSSSASYWLRRSQSQSTRCFLHTFLHSFIPFLHVTVILTFLYNLISFPSFLLTFFLHYIPYLFIYLFFYIYIP